MRFGTELFDYVDITCESDLRRIISSSTFGGFAILENWQDGMYMGAITISRKDKENTFDAMIEQHSQAFACKREWSFDEMVELFCEYFADPKNLTSKYAFEPVPWIR